MKNPASTDATWQVSGDSTGVAQDRGMCEEKRTDDHPAEGGALNSGRPSPIPCEEIYLQRINDFRPQGIATLKRKLQGYWNYYGVIGNSEQTWNYAWFAKMLVYKWLNRRSQRKSFTVASFVAAWERWQMPDPGVNEKPWPRTAGQHQPRPV